MAAILGLPMAATTVAPGMLAPPTTSRAAVVAVAPHGGRGQIDRPSSLSAGGNLRPPVAGRAAAVAPAAAAAATPSSGGALAGDEEPEYHSDLPSISMGRRRRSLAAAAAATLVLLGRGSPRARGAILEADDDVELLEKVKEDRKKRLERQGVLSTSGKERGYLQELVFRLSRVGRAIDNDDIGGAGSILGPDGKAEWVQNVSAAFSKLSSSSEEKAEADTFNTSLVSLIASVAKKDVELSKQAFVTSASALEKWMALAGLAAEITGL